MAKKKKATKEAEETNPMGILQKLKTQAARSRMSLSDSVEDEHPQLGHGRSLHSSHGSTLEADLPEWYEEMTEDNVSAFKDLFEMLDSSNTGTLTADNLYEGMMRIDSEITRDEVEKALRKLDKDGNGEIDFDEFLYHMTQGDFAEGGDEDGGDKKKKKFSRRQRLFYTAITQYSLKNSLGVSFGTSLRQPHVISHYTAGVRLIGLTDRQLTEQMKKMQKTARNNTSPYAKPLPFAQFGAGSRAMHRPGQIGKKDIRSKYKLPVSQERLPTTSLKVPLGISEVTESSSAEERKEGSKAFQPRESIVSKLPGGYLITKIKKQILSKAFSQKMGTALDSMPFIREEKVERTARKKRKKRRKTHVGWTTPKVDYLTVPLPELKVKLCKKQRPTIDDLPNIREKATEALDEFYKCMQKEVVRHSYDHWERLYADTIRPKKLLENFRSVYRAYSPHKQEEAFVVTPWIPGPYRRFRRGKADLNLPQTPFGASGSFSSARYHSTEGEMRPVSSLV